MKTKYCFILLIGIIGFIESCKPNETEEPTPVDPEPIVLDPVAVEVTRSLTDKTTYFIGDDVTVGSFEINNLSDETVSFDSVWIEIGRASNNGVQVEYSAQIEVTDVLDGGESVTVPPITFSTEGLVNNSYLVHIGAQLGSPDETKILSQSVRKYLTFLRITEDVDKLSFTIDQERLGDLPVYQLRGGLSAEYAVQKSLASLNRGISHSWSDINPPRLSSPDFLQRSIERTINIYNETLGGSRKIKTVFLSTGITPVTFIAGAMDAPILPLHFLVGASTTKEIQTILDFANQNGTPAYATYGHDYSLSTTQGVAWIKMLELPIEYQQFLIDHQVEEIVFLGATASGGGEKAARQYQNGVNHRQAGSIYLMYFARLQAEGFLRRVIKDFNPNDLGSLINIEDWESGIIQRQVDNMTAVIRQNTAVNSLALVTSSVNDIHLWNLATYATIKFFHVNDRIPKGVSLNPYLAGHPFYEKFQGLIPFTYFNSPAIPVTSHIGRVNGMLTNAVAHFFPDVAINDLAFIANSGTSSDFFLALQEEGYTVSNLPNKDVWDLADGLDTPAEVRAMKLIDTSTQQERLEWAEQVQYLTLSDLKELASIFNEILITDQ